MAQVEHFTPDMPAMERAQTILARALRIIEAAPGECALFLAGTAGLGIVFDFNGWSEGGANILVNIATIALGYLMACAMLRRSGLAPDGLTAGFGTYFGIAFLSGIGILLGLLLLIVPGIILLVRWAPATGYGLAGGTNANGALTASWHDTGPHFWPILLAMLVPAATMIAGAVIYLGPLLTDGQLGPVAIVLGNILMMGSSVVSAAIGMAVYGLVGASGAGLGDVFD